jgi:hypothetical protein
VEAAEVDEMWSFVGSKVHQRWLWHAIDHLTGVVLAYVLGSRADKVFLQLQKLLKPFGLCTFIPMLPESMLVICQQLPIPSAKSTPSRSNANI